MVVQNTSSTLILLVEINFLSVRNIHVFFGSAPAVNVIENYLHLAYQRRTKKAIYFVEI